jgi:hypothetical protein
MAAHMFVVVAVVGVAPQEFPGKPCALHTIEISGRVLRPPAFIIRHAITPASLGLKRGMPLPVTEYSERHQRAEVLAAATGVAESCSTEGDGIDAVT